MKPTPFKFSVRLLQWFCDPDLLPSIEGDLFELFEEQTKSKGILIARWQFLWQVIKLFRPGIIKSFTGQQRLNKLGMINNYLKIGWRNIVKQKQFSGINIIGLSIGLAASLFILLYINNEMSYDKYHKKVDRIYRVLHAYGQKDIPNTDDFQVWGSAPVGPAMQNLFPEMEMYCRFTSPFICLLENENQKFQEDHMIFADSSAFRMFSWPLLLGDSYSALSEPNSIVLTKPMAIKYFGTTDVLGKTIIADHDDPLKITGVLDDIPAQSQLTFDALVSMSSFHKMRPGIFDNWGYVDFYTYFLLNEHASLDHLRSKTSHLYELAGPEMEGYFIDYEPMKGAYLNSKADRQPGPVGSLSNVKMLACIGLFIIIIACVNFINLATARSVERAKEVGVRKTLGALKGDLTFQFLAESIVIAIFSGFLALGLVSILFSYFEILVGKPVAYKELLTIRNVGLLFLTSILIGLLAGIYPALVLAKFKTTSVLKGKFKSSKSGVKLRQGLVVFQFGLAIALILATTVVYDQLRYMKNQEKGFTQEQMVVVDFGWDYAVQKRIKTIKSEFNTHPDVLSVSASRAVPGDFFPNAGTGIERPTGDIEYHGPGIFEIDEDFIENFEMEMVAGRSFSKNFPLDSAQSLIINEAALPLYGYNNAEEIIGKKFAQWGREGKVIGVVKDFNYKSLHEKVEPLSIRYAQHRDLRRFAIKVRSNDMHKTITELESLWNDIVPQRPFNFVFLDQTFNEHYTSDIRFGRLFGIFALIAIFIACLGLLGLTVYSTEQRAKEIGIRKVLGASISNIMRIISQEFVVLILIAIFIATPVAWYVMQQWLESFAYRVAIGVDTLALAIASTLLIAAFTIGWQILKMATANPVDVIKDE